MLIVGGEVGVVAAEGIEESLGILGAAQYEAPRAAIAGELLVAVAVRAHDGCCNRILESWKGPVEGIGVYDECSVPAGDRRAHSAEWVKEGTGVCPRARLAGARVVPPQMYAAGVDCCVIKARGEDCVPGGVASYKDRATRGSRPLGESMRGVPQQV